MIRFTLDDVVNWAGDSNFLKTCSVYAPIPTEQLKRLCLYFPVINPEFKAVLVELALRALPEEERRGDHCDFNCWGTFDTAGTGGGLLLYTAPAFRSWARISKIQVFKDRVNKLYLGVIRRPMTLNHV